MWTWLVHLLRLSGHICSTWCEWFDISGSSVQCFVMDSYCDPSYFMIACCVPRPPPTQHAIGAKSVLGHVRCSITSRILVMKNGLRFWARIGQFWFHFAANLWKSLHFCSYFGKTLLSAAHIFWEKHKPHMMMLWYFWCRIWILTRPKSTNWANLDQFGEILFYGKLIVFKKNLDSYISILDSSKNFGKYFGKLVKFWSKF